jgi:undecaprenyl-diphosphatase
MPPSAAPLPLPHAVALGALHGPAELLPISSSAHVALVPQLLGWPSAQLDDDVRKAFEVALHAGTLAGLVFLVPWPRPAWAAVATVPAALIGFALEDVVERRLGGRRATAAGLVIGSGIMLAADHRAGEHARRTASGATLADAACIGAAQALAFWPGVSRLGVTLSAARLRGFDRESSFALGRATGLPIVAGATALKSYRLLRKPPPPPLRRAFAAGMAAALASTLAAAPLRNVRSLTVPALERVALATFALRTPPAR